MIAVGIRELKAKLSHYVDQVGRGEEIVVTARGREVALLVSITRERRTLKQLADIGRARMPKGKPQGTHGVRVKGKPLSDTVIEDRR